MSPQTVRRFAWAACYILVFVSAFFLSGTQQPPLELDPSWHTALEYATEHHLQFGTEISFTFGPLGFLSARTSLGHLLGARVSFAFFWSALVALAATGLAKRLPGWVRYAFLGWLVVFTLSGGLDQTVFFVMAYGALLLLADNPKQRWQAPPLVLAFILLSLIKVSFLIAGLGGIALVVVCWIGQRKTRRAIVLALTTLGGFVACWVALGQSPSHLAPWFWHGLDLASGYSGAMSLVPKTPVLYAALAALVLFAGALIATIVRARGRLFSWTVVIALAVFGFLAWKEGFTRPGDWHTFVFLWFLPLGLAFCFLGDLSSAPTASHRGVLEVTFAASMALCVVAANFQISGFALKQAVDCPQRVSHNAEMLFATLRERSGDLYADCRDAKNNRMLLLERAKDVIGSDSVDVMNYLSLAAVVNDMNYRPRPVFQGFVAYTPALQRLNEEYFQSECRPHFVMLCQQATDGRYPTLEDSGALNYVLNNYVPVARDGPFLILQQRTKEVPAFQLVHEQILHFGERLNLAPWAHAPLFISVSIAPSLLGQAVTFLYQQGPLYMRVFRNAVQRRYRIVPSMAARPFLLNPLLDSNYDVMKLYTSRAGKESDSVVFERPEQRSFEFRGDLAVRLYTAPTFLRAAREISSARMLADVQGRAFWPEPKSVESPAPSQIMIFHGSPALFVHPPSKIIVEIPPHASAFSGYFGAPEGAYLGGGKEQGVHIAIEVCDKSGKCRRRFDRLLQPFLRAGDRGRFPFRVPIDSFRDRTIVLITDSDSSGSANGTGSVWSQCRFEETHVQ